MSSRGDSTPSSTTPANVGQYLERLADALAPLPASDRREIVAETESHIRDRRSGCEEETLVERIVRTLGPPERYAQQFLENYDVPARSGEGHGDASPTWRSAGARWASAFLGLLSAVLLLFSVLLSMTRRDAPPWLIWAELAFGSLSALAALSVLVALLSALLAILIRRRRSPRLGESLQRGRATS